MGGDGSCVEGDGILGGGWVMTRSIDLSADAVDKVFKAISETDPANTDAGGASPDAGGAKTDAGRANADAVPGFPGASSGATGGGAISDRPICCRAICGGAICGEAVCGGATFCLTSASVGTGWARFFPWLAHSSSPSSFIFLINISSVTNFMACICIYINGNLLPLAPNKAA